jgi:hypothetical protein
VEFANGFWANKARECGTTMYRVIKGTGKSDSTIYRWLDGDEGRIGKPTKKLVAKGFGHSLRWLLDTRADHLATKSSAPNLRVVKS